MLASLAAAVIASFTMPTSAFELRAVLRTSVRARIVPSRSLIMTRSQSAPTSTAATVPVVGSTS